MTSGSHARSFDGWAADYDRYRPGYPALLFDRIMVDLGLGQQPEVVDLGAGTGMATFAMAARGWRVTAVEPGAQMLEVLRERAGRQEVEVAAVEATAEVTGLPDASADLAVAAQAFHWFDRPRAVGEMARIVRPGGGAALFWNVRDAERSALVADYEQLIARYFGAAGIGQYQQDGAAVEHAATRAAFAAAPSFEEPRYAEPTHDVTMVAEEFIGMAFTASYVRRLGAGEQQRLHRELVALLERHDRGEGAFSIPYRIHLWTARRLDR